MSHGDKIQLASIFNLQKHVTVLFSSLPDAILSTRLHGKTPRLPPHIMVNIFQEIYPSLRICFCYIRMYSGSTHWSNRTLVLVAKLQRVAQCAKKLSTTRLQPLSCCHASGSLGIPDFWFIRSLTLRAVNFKYYLPIVLFWFIIRHLNSHQQIFVAIAD